MKTDREIHDELLRRKPESANHDSDACRFCTEQEDDQVAGEDKIFTQEQHEQLLASAVEKASTSARAEADAEVVSLNEKLAAAEETIAERDSRIAELEATIAERDEAARLETLGDERAAKVQEVASFSQEQIDKRKPEWATMSEEAFAGYLEDMAAVATATKKPHVDTSFETVRETAGKDENEESVIRSFFSNETARVAAER